MKVGFSKVTENQILRKETENMEKLILADGT